MQLRKTTEVTSIQTQDSVFTRGEYAYSIHVTSDYCELPQNIHALSTERLQLVHRILYSVYRLLVHYLQPTHEAICGFCETFVLARRGRYPTIPKTLIVVAEKESQ